MKYFFSSCILLFFTFSLCPAIFVDACTTMIVTKGASRDGSVYVVHSDDDDLEDQSIVYVPAKDWPKDS